MDMTGSVGKSRSERPRRVLLANPDPRSMLASFLALITEPLDIATRDVPADQFDDCVMLCAQHLIPSQLPLFDEFIAHGAEASDVFVAGVPYSTNPLVAGMLRARGMSVVESITMMAPEPSIEPAAPACLPSNGMSS